MNDDQAAIWAVVNDMYAAYLDNDRDRLEAHLAEDCTLWDSGVPELRTKAQLAAVRREPDPTEVRPVTLSAADPIININGDSAWECHTLHAGFVDTSLDQDLRCTSIMRRTDDGWKFVHHHEERLSL